MKYLIRPVLALVAVGGLCAAAPQADARQWNATPAALAQDYAQIVDQRNNGEIVLVMWIVPEMLPDKPETRAAREALGQFVFVGAVHGDVSPAGTMSFRSGEEVLLRTQGGEQRSPLDPNLVPPVAAGIMAAMERLFVQSLGPMGQGTQWVTFDGAGVDSCDSGVVWIDYAGEQYEYRTPIPGCP